jgi:hypothetical protein
MKTLYESILSSTNSGKYFMFDEKYLLKHGFKKYTDHKIWKKDTYIHEKTGLVISYFKDASNDGWCVDMANKELRRLNIPFVQLIKNIPTLELAIKWKEAVNNDDEKEEEKLNKKLKEMVTDINLS